GEDELPGRVDAADQRAEDGVLRARVRDGAAAGRRGPAGRRAARRGAAGRRSAGGRAARGRAAAAGAGRVELAVHEVRLVAALHRVVRAGLERHRRGRALEPADRRADVDAWAGQVEVVGACVVDGDDRVRAGRNDRRVPILVADVRAVVEAKADR